MKIIISKQYKKKKSSFVLVHGWEGGPNKDWFPWLNNKLIKGGYEVLNMSMPNPLSPVRSKWVEHLKDHVKASSKTFFIAHSIGCMAVLRYLEEINTKIKAVILVAPYITNEKKYKIISSFFYGDIKWKKINKNCDKFFTIFSDNDPFVSLDQLTLINKEIDTNSMVLHNKGHFDVPEIDKLYELVVENR